MPAAPPAPPRPTWTPTARAFAFALAATSIAALLSEFYGVSTMRAFVLWVQLPATIVLVAWAVASRSRGDGRLAHAVFVGLAAGFTAAIAYDVFRLPFVFAKPLGIDGFVPALPLFKVFPRFGAMILGQPLEQAAYSATAQLLGWAYHFSNGATFGVMYLALAGDPARRSPWWGIVFAVGLEIGLLLTPYAQTFGIAITPTFIAVTLTAHLVFGAAMGLLVQRWWRGA